MRIATRTCYSVLVLAAAALASCSGGGSGSSGPSLSLAVTDSASDELSTFVIGLDSVALLRAVGAPVQVLQEPLAVDFAELSDLSRVLNVTAIPVDTYTGVQVVLLYDNDRVVINGKTTPAALLDSDGNTLTGTQTLTVDFPVPIFVTAATGHVELELDLDLGQSADVDATGNQVYLEPELLPRIDPTVVREHAIGGALRTVVLADDRFRIGLDALPGDPVPVVTVTVGAGTVFQVDGACFVGLAGLAALDNLPVGAWVQAFGTMASSGAFDAATVEAGTGSYNGGSDIVEGVITGITGSDFAVRGHSNNSTHTVFEFNLNYTATANPANTKVVRRGSGALFDTDTLNVGQLVRMFGAKSGNVLDVSTTTDVIRFEPTHVYGTANGAPAGGFLEITLLRVDLRDAAIFNWAQGGVTPADPAHFLLDVQNLGTGQGIVAGKPVEALGFFTAADDAGTTDFTASTLANRDLIPSLFLLRDRTNGLTVTPTTAASHIDFAFSGAAGALEKAVVDQGFAGQVDVTGPGLSVVPVQLGLGFYTIRDRTLNTFALYLTFSSFSQAVQTKLGSATLFNFGAVGIYDSTQDEIASALASAVFQ